MRFLVNCYSAHKRPSTKSRANFLRRCCDVACIHCQEWSASGNEGDYLVVIDEQTDAKGVNNTALWQMNMLISFCALHDYPLVRVPDNPLEEFLHKYYS